MKKKTNQSYNNIALTNPDLHDKSNQFKRSSPNKKGKTKSKIIAQTHYNNPLTSTYYNQTLYGRKHRNQQTDAKISSNQSSTHCSLNRTKKQKNGEVSIKKTKKLRQNTLAEKTQNIKLGPQQIMQLINSYATKIQRQWRRYWFRKCLRFLIVKERQNKQFNKYSQKQEKQSKNIQKLKRISQEAQRIRQFNKLNVSLQQSQIAQNCNNLTNGYNNQKYASLQSISSRKYLQNPFNCVQLSTQKKIQNKRLTGNQIQKEDICVQADLFKQIQKSDQKVRSLYQSSENAYNRLGFSPSEQGYSSAKADQYKRKSMKIDYKILEYQIVNDKSNSKERQTILLNNFQTIQKKSNTQNKNASINSQTKIQNQGKFEQQYIQTNRGSINSLHKLTDDKYPYQMMFKKCRKALEGSKLNKLLSIQSKYTNNQITHKTYERVLKEINDKHQDQIKMIQIRQGSIKNTWNQVYRLYRENSAKDSSFFQDKSLIEDHQLQNSMCFDKWDFESSAKKSISNVESFEQFARQLNRKHQKQKEQIPKNIQLVLDQLNQIQEKQQTRYKKQRVNSFQKKGYVYSNQQVKIEQPLHYQIKYQEKTKHREQQNDQQIYQHSIQGKIEAIEKEYVSQSLQPKVKQTVQISQNNQIQGNNIIGNQKQLLQFEPFSIKITKQNSTISQIQTPSKIEELANQKGTCFAQSQVTFKQMQFNSPKIKQKTKRLLHNYYDKSQTELNQSYQIEDEQLLSRQNKSIQFPSSQNINLFFNYENKSPIHISISKDSETSIKDKEDPQTQYQLAKFMQLKQKLIVKDLREVLSFCSKKKRQNKQKIQKELRKYCSIQPNIDSINGWLLQICHFLLDHHQNQIKSNLIHIKMPSERQLLKLAYEERQYQKSYDTIPQRLFKQFQFFNIKQISKNMQIQAVKYQNFSSMLYSFHRCLVDGLNQTLLDQLITGRNWVVLPWLNQFRCKKKVTEDHAKSCLQRSINRVSNWGQYCMGQIQVNKDMSQFQWKQYQQQKMSLIIRQEALQLPLQNHIFLTSLIIKISQQVFVHEITLAASQMFNNQQHKRN